MDSHSQSGEHKSGKDHECLSVAWHGFTLGCRQNGIDQCNVGPWDIFPLELQVQHRGLDVSKQEAWADGPGPG